MIIVLTGPTGSGKSALAIELANRIGAAIINADAFQVYQELSIATAKPSLQERSLAPHYLFDFVPLDEEYSVYSYQKDLRRTVAELEGRYPHLIIAGGTGLYIRSALYDYEFTESPKVDMSRFDSYSNEELHDELKKVDSEAAEAIHMNNRRRVLRALEIYLSTGKRKSEIEGEQTHKPIYQCLFFGLNKEREDVYSLCDRRVDKMFDMGLLEENKRLFDLYGTDKRAFQAIGVKETIPYFEGEIGLEECKRQIKVHTRQYVKRQMTFFSHQFELDWIDEIGPILDKIAAKPK